MIEGLLAFGLLVVSASVVILFAMFGQLAGQVVRGTGKLDEGAFLKPLPGAPIGKSPAVWPERLRSVAGSSQGVVLALSTSCHSCERIAPGLIGFANGSRKQEIAIVVACPTSQAGDAFIARHGLDKATHWVDYGGSWLRGEVGVTTSPTCLIFQDGSLHAALVFTDPAALERALNSVDPAIVDGDVDEIARWARRL